MIVALTGANGNMGKETLKSLLECEEITTLRILVKQDKKSRKEARKAKRKYGEKGKSPVEVVAAFIKDGDRFMICRRPEGKARAGLWEFVGGKAEAGETLEQALERECREEIGVSVRVGNVYTETLYDYPDISVHLTIFYATIESGTPRSMENNAIAWIEPSEIPNYSFCPADIPIMKRIMEEGMEQAKANE